MPTEKTQTKQQQNKQTTKTKRHQKKKQPQKHRLKGPWRFHFWDPV
jgi:hypothetical protein